MVNEKKKVKWYILIITLVIFGCLIWGFVELIRLIISSISGLDPTVMAAVVIVSGTVIVSVITTIASKYFEDKRRIREGQRKYKIKLYDGFLDFWFNMMPLPENLVPGVDSEISVEFLRDFSKNLILWGSDGLIKTYAKFRKLGTIGVKLSIEELEKNIKYVPMFFIFEKLFSDMRVDLGHKNKGFKAGDILSIFVNNVHETMDYYRKKRKENK